MNRKCKILILLAPKALSDEQKEAVGGQRATTTLSERDGKQERAATAAENVTVKHW